MCPPTFKDPAALTEWLQDAICCGQVGGPWEGRFPRYVWLVKDGVCYEGRLVNQELGEYKGYPFTKNERPEWLDDRP